MSAGSNPGVVYQEPPPPQAEVVSVRPGHVWIKGRWDWRGSQWVWIGGHWERERSGQYWSEGRWDRRNGNQWVWVEGTWGAQANNAPMPVGPSPDRANGGVSVTPSGGGGAYNPPPPAGPSPDRANGGVTVTVSGGAYPSSAPPARRAETAGNRPGYVWIYGRWDWRNGQWAWIDGHWEHARSRPHRIRTATGEHAGPVLRTAELVAVEPEARNEYAPGRCLLREQVVVGATA
jgi:hypothetical protein